MKDPLLHDCPLCPAIILAKVDSYRIFPMFDTAHITSYRLDTGRRFYGAMRHTAPAIEKRSPDGGAAFASAHTERRTGDTLMIAHSS
jgi:hypothetical protein